MFFQTVLIYAWRDSDHSRRGSKNLPKPILRYVLDQSLDKSLVKIENIWSHGTCRIMLLETTTKLVFVRFSISSKIPFLFEFLKLG